MPPGLKVANDEGDGISGSGAAADVARSGGTGVVGQGGFGQGAFSSRVGQDGGAGVVGNGGAGVAGSSDRPGTGVVGNGGGAYGDPDFGVMFGGAGVVGNGGVGELSGGAGVVGNGGLSALSGGTGVYGIGGAHGEPNGRTGLGVIGKGDIGVSGKGSTYGVYGEGGTYAVYGHSPRGNGVAAYTDSGYTYALWAQGPRYAAGLFGKTVIGGSVVIMGDVSVSGTLSATAKSAVVKVPDGSHRALYCVESPECWFEDFGRSRLVRGKARVRLDRTFAAVVRTRDYHVFLSPEGLSHGLYVSRLTRDGFEVREQHRGTSTVPFSYRIVALRKDVDAPRFRRVKLPTFPKPPRPPKAKLPEIPKPPLPSTPEGLLAPTRTRNAVPAKSGRRRQPRKR